MPNDNRKKLYETLNKGGYYKKSYEEFNTQFSNPENRTQLYNALNKGDFYKKSIDDFNNQFFSDVKKKDQPQTTSTGGGVVQTPPQPSQPSLTASEVWSQASSQAPQTTAPTPTDVVSESAGLDVQSPSGVPSPNVADIVIPDIERAESIPAYQGELTQPQVDIPAPTSGGMTYQEATTESTIPTANALNIQAERMKMANNKAMMELDMEKETFNDIMNEVRDKYKPEQIAKGEYLDFAREEFRKRAKGVDFTNLEGEGYQALNYLEQKLLEPQNQLQKDLSNVSIRKSLSSNPDLFDQSVMSPTEMAGEVVREDLVNKYGTDVTAGEALFLDQDDFNMRNIIPSEYEEISGDYWGTDFVNNAREVYLEDTANKKQKDLLLKGSSIFRYSDEPFDPQKSQEDASDFYKEVMAQKVKAYMSPWNNDIYDKINELEDLLTKQRKGKDIDKKKLVSLYTEIQNLQGGEGKQVYDPITGQYHIQNAPTLGLESQAWGQEVDEFKKQYSDLGISKMRQELDKEVLKQEERQRILDKYKSKGVPMLEYAPITEEYQNGLKKIQALSDLVAFNYDPSKSGNRAEGLKGFATGVGKGVYQGITGKDYQGDYEDDVYRLNLLREAGMPLNEEIEKYMTPDDWEDTGKSVGGSLVAGGKIGIELALGNKLKGVMGIPKIIERLAGGNGLKKRILDGAFDANMYGTSYELAGESYATGLGEYGGERLGGRLAKNIKLNPDGLTSLLVEWGSGNLTEMGAELSGELVDRIATGENVDEALVGTLGLDTKEGLSGKLKELALHTMILSGGPMSTKTYGVVKNKIKNLRNKPNKTQEEIEELEILEDNIDETKAKEVENQILNDEELAQEYSEIKDKPEAELTAEEKLTKQNVEGVIEDMPAEQLAETKIGEQLEIEFPEDKLQAQRDKIADIEGQTKTKEDAVQEQSTESVDVREQPTDGEGVGVEDTKGEEITQESQEVQEEVTEPQDGDTISQPARIEGGLEKNYRYNAENGTWNEIDSQGNELGGEISPTLSEKLTQDFINQKQEQYESKRVNADKASDGSSKQTVPSEERLRMEQKDDKTVGNEQATEPSGRGITSQEQENVTGESVTKETEGQELKSPPPAKETGESSVEEKKIDKNIPKIIARRIAKGDLTEKQANDLIERSKYKKANNEQDSKTADDLKEKLGLDEAYEYVNDPNSKVNNRVKADINAAKYESLVSKSNDNRHSQEKRNQFRREADMLLLERAFEKTSKGADIQYEKKLQEKYKSLSKDKSIVEKVRLGILEKLAEETEGGITVEERIESLRDGVKKAVSDSLNKDVKKLLEENQNLKRTIEKLVKNAVNKSNVTRKAELKDNVQKAKDKLKKAWKNRGKGPAQATLLPGLTLDVIEALGELVVAYAKSELYNSKQVIDKVFKDAKEIGKEITKEDISKIASDINEFKELNKKDPSELIDDEISREVKAEDLLKLASEYYLDPSLVKESLIKKISDKYGLSVNDSKKLAKEINNAIENVVENRLSKELEKEYKEKEGETLIEKKERLAKQAENRKLINRVKKTVLLGGLSNAEFVNSFSDKYGFENVNPDTIRGIESLYNDALRFEKEGKRELLRKTQVKLNNLLKGLEPVDAKKKAQFIQELDHTNILSGVNTQFNAGLGGALMTGVNGLSFTLRNLTRPGAVLYGVSRAFSKANIKATLSEANQAGRLNFTKYDTREWTNTTSASNEYQSKMQQQVLKGVGSYIRQVSKEKNLSENTKLILKELGQVFLQYQRMLFMLKAQDAILRGVTSEYVNAVKEYNNAMKGYGFKPLNSIFNYAPLSRTASKALSYDNYKKYKKDAEAELLFEYNEIAKSVDNEIKDGNLKKSDRDNEINDRASSMFGKSMYGAIKGKFKGNKDGLARYNGYISRRAKDMMEADRDQELQSKGNEIASEWIGMNEPDKGLGMLVTRGMRAVTSVKEGDSEVAAAGKTFASLFLKFPRLTGNMINIALTSFPIFGVIPATISIRKAEDGRTKFAFAGKGNMEMYKQQLMTNLIMTTTAGIFLNHMFDWDEDDNEWKLSDDRLFDITSTGYGQYGKNIQAEEGWQDFAIRFRATPQSDWGAYRKVQYMPQSIGMISLLGRFSDDIKGYNSEREGMEFKESGFWGFARPRQMADMALKPLLEGSFNSIGRSAKKLTYSKSETETFGNALLEFGVQPVKNILQPAFVRDIFNEAGAFTGQSKKVAGKGIGNIHEFLAKDFYGLDYFLTSKTDAFGDEIPKDSKLLQWYRGYYKHSKDSKFQRLMYKYDDMIVTNFHPKDKNSARGKTYYINDEDVKQELWDYQKKEFKKYTNKKYNLLDSYEAERLQKEMTKIRNKATSNAKKYIYDKYKDTDKLRITKN